MARISDVSDAITLIFRQDGERGVAANAVRGEMFFCVAEVFDLVADSGGAQAEEARKAARRYRRKGRELLGGVA